MDTPGPESGDRLPDDRLTAEDGDSTASAAEGAVAEEAELVTRWIDAFNARDLTGMLSCVAPHILFQPLRLHGVERTYSGHDGITRWHQRLFRLDLAYQIHIEDLSIPAERTVLATGHLHVEGMTASAPFWGVHTIDTGLIVVARHYLGDEDMAEKYALPG